MKKKHLRVIKEIHERIPKELLLNLTKKEMQAPSIKKVMEHALTRPDSEVSPTQKRHFKALLDSGRLDREVEVLDHDIEKQIDQFLKDEIDLAVKLGRLPAKAPTLQMLNNKGNRYARKKHKQLKQLFTGEDNDVESEKEDDKNIKSQSSQVKNNGGILLEPGRFV